MKRSNGMLRFVYLIALTAVALCVVNVLFVVVGHIHLRSMTDLDPYISSVATVSETVYAKRGNIYDANGEIIAQDQKTYDIICYLDKGRTGYGNKIAYIDDPLYTSQVLSTILDMEQSEIYYYLTYNPKLYQTELGPKGKNLSEETMNEILNYPNIHGIGFTVSNKRTYSKGSSFAPYLIGFAQNNDDRKLVGKMGLELYLNDELSGTDGKHIYQTSAGGYILEGMYEEYEKEQDGCDVYLTLDSSVQEALETSFREIQEYNGASKAWGAVVEVNTGKILAWGQTPGFDPNTLEIDEYMNYGSQSQYEAGSVMKSFIYAAAMDSGVYDGHATFNSEPYCYLSSSSGEPYRSYGDYYGCIGNAGGKTWGTIELDYGLIYSSNVATSTLLSSYVGSARFLDYMKAFGFFDYVGTDGIDETKGTLNYRYPSEKLSLTFGQGSSVTTLQILQAYTSIFGNGELLRPYYIDKVVNPNTGEIVYQGERTVVGKPISESTAKQVQQLMERVVTDKGGTAQYYAVDEVDIIAKTGTSEIAVNSGYESSDSINSVIIGFPADNPRYMIYYAYQVTYNYYGHLNSAAIQNLIKRVALLTNVGYNPNENQINNAITKSEMENLSSRDYYSTYAELESKGYDVVRIGNGNTVIGQYPKAGSDVYSNEKILLLTNGDLIDCPDFDGWTRKELIAYWNLSGVPITMDGYGVAYEQSVTPGTPISKATEVTVRLKQIETTIDTTGKIYETPEKDDE